MKIIKTYLSKLSVRNKYNIIYIFAFSFLVLSVFVYTKNQTPHDAELSFVEKSPSSIGSVVPASCEAGYVHIDSANTTGDPNFCAEQLIFTSSAYNVPYGGSAMLTWTMPTGDQYIYQEPFSNRGFSNAFGGWAYLPESARIVSCMGSNGSPGWTGERYTESNINITTPGTQYGWWWYIGGLYHWFKREEVVTTGPLYATTTFTLTCYLEYRDGDPNTILTIGSATRNLTITVTPPATPTVNVEFQ